MQRGENGNAAGDARENRDVETGFHREPAANHVTNPSERVHLTINPLALSRAQQEGPVYYAKGFKRTRLQAVSADCESDDSDLGDRDSPDFGGANMEDNGATLEPSEAPTYSTPPMANGHATPDDSIAPNTDIYPDLSNLEQPAEETPCTPIRHNDFCPSPVVEPTPDNPQLNLSPNSSLTPDTESEGTSVDPLQPLYISEEDLIPTYGTNEDMLAPCIQSMKPGDQVADFVANNNHNPQEEEDFSHSDDSLTESFSSNDLKENSLQPSWDENGVPNSVATGPYSFHNDISIIGNPYSNIFDKSNVNNRNKSLDVLDDQDAVPL